MQARVVEVLASKDSNGAVEQERVKLQAVINNTPENKEWSRWTPSASFEIWISNPEAFGKLSRATSSLWTSPGGNGGRQADPRRAGRNVACHPAISAATNSVYSHRAATGAPQDALQKRERPGHHRLGPSHIPVIRTCRT